MIYNIIGLIIGILILGAGIFTFIKEKTDRESRKIYGITMGAGGSSHCFALSGWLFYRYLSHVSNLQLQDDKYRIYDQLHKHCKSYYDFM